MIRNLTIIAGASFILAVACFAGAAATGGRDIVKNGWTFPADWNMHISDNGREESVRIGRGALMVAGDGDLRTRDVAWTGADQLQIDLPAQVTFTQGPKASLSITGPAAILDRVQIDGGRMYLTGDGESQSLRVDHGGVRILDDTDRLTIVVTAPSVRAFTLNGSGDLDIRDFDQPELAVSINGSGDVTGVGKTGRLTLRIAGSGEADLDGLDTGDVEVSVAGSGEARVAPRGAARVAVAGSGDVVLVTRPASLSSDVAGSGEVHESW